MNIILIYFAVKYQGNWDLIFKALENREKVSFRELESLEQKIKVQSWKILTILDHDYPPQLKVAYKPPFVIWYEGDVKLFQHKIICLSGNDTTEIIEQKIPQFINYFVTRDYVFVSSNYAGVDRHVLKQNPLGAIIILAAGIDSLNYQSLTYKTPPLVITEYPPQTLTTKVNLKHRNRLIASFSEFLVLFSSYKNGGINDLVTNFLNLGREIFCFPGDGTENDGNSELIKQGAQLVIVPEDIIQ